MGADANTFGTGDDPVFDKDGVRRESVFTTQNDSSAGAFREAYALQYQEAEFLREKVFESRQNRRPQTYLLGDDVGLGKTWVGMITLFSLLNRDGGKSQGLIVAPTRMLVGKWVHELEAFRRSYVKNGDDFAIETVGSSKELLSRLEAQKNYKGKGGGKAFFTFFSKSCKQDVVKTMAESEKIISHLKKLMADIAKGGMDDSPSLTKRAEKNVLAAKAFLRHVLTVFSRERDLKNHSSENIKKIIKWLGISESTLSDLEARLLSAMPLYISESEVMQLPSLLQRLRSSNVGDWSRVPLEKGLVRKIFETPKPRGRYLSKLLWGFFTKNKETDEEILDLNNEAALALVIFAASVLPWFRRIRNAEQGATLLNGKTALLEGIWDHELDPSEELWNRKLCRRVIYVMYNRDLWEVEGDAVFQTKEDLDKRLPTSPKPLRFAIIDEVHNWANGNNGADSYRKYWQPRVKNTLLMTATPLQLGFRELATILECTSESLGKEVKQETNLKPKSKQIELYENVIQSLQTANDTQSDVLTAVKALREEDQQFLTSLTRKDGKALKPEAIWQEASGSRCERVRTLAKNLLDFQRALSGDFQGHLVQLMMKNLAKHNRQYFCGKDVDRLLQDASTESCGRDGFYRVQGIDNDAKLFCRVCMRIASIGKGGKSETGTPDLMLGLGSSFEAFFNSSVYTKKVEGEAANPRVHEYVKAFLDPLKDELHVIHHPKVRKEERRVIHHPKVRKTVKLILHNLFECGEKTVVFCEWQKTVDAIADAVAEEIENRFEEKKEDALQCFRQVLIKQLQVQEECIGDELLKLTVPESRGLIQKALEEAAKVSFEAAFPGIPWHLRMDQANYDARIALALRWAEGLVPASLMKKVHGTATVGQRIRSAADLLLERPEFSSNAGDDSESTNAYKFNPVRKLKGDTPSLARSRILANFASPDAPAVLVCTPVSQEGVDMHLFCRRIILHDLNWNPAKLEQRIGRIDRRGSLAAVSGKPVIVAVPFLSASYDEYKYEVLLERADLQDFVFGRKNWVILEQSEKELESGKTDEEKETEEEEELEQSNDGCNAPEPGEDMRKKRPLIGHLVKGMFKVDLSLESVKEKYHG